MTYEEQLNDHRWKAKAKEIKLRDNETCQVCGNKRRLNVHHVEYKFGLIAWEYSDDYLITLCNKCHEWEHECKMAIRTLLADANKRGMLYMDLYSKLKPILNL